LFFHPFHILPFTVLHALAFLDLDNFCRYSNQRWDRFDPREGWQGGVGLCYQGFDNQGFYVTSHRWEHFWSSWKAGFSNPGACWGATNISSCIGVLSASKFHI